MSSIGDNGSGGIYAYRTSKAAMNMVARTMAMDFKKMENGIAVQAIGDQTHWDTSDISRRSSRIPHNSKALFVTNQSTTIAIGIQK